MSDLATLTCASCTDRDSDGWDNWWDLFKCIQGRVFGPCSSDNCDGVCEFAGPCDCQCHQDPA